MTADTYSTDGVGVLLMGTGNDNNTWGSNANNNVFQYLVDAIANSLTSAVTGGTLDLSGTPPPAASSQTRFAELIFTGALTSNQVVIVPNLAKRWWVYNNTSGAFTLKIKTTAGTASSAIPLGRQVVSCDGSDVITVQPYNGIQAQMPATTASKPSFSSINETNSGWYLNTTQDWRLAINALDVLQVTGAGAASPSIVNVLSPNALQVGGVAVGINWVASGGSADAITATYSPAVASLTDGLLCFFRATAANTTTTPTFAPNGLTARTIVKAGGVALLPGDIPGNLAEVILRYNLANTRWELLNPAPPLWYPSPQVRISLTSNTPVISTDVTDASSVYVMPYGGNGVPIWNGNATAIYTFSQQTLTLVAGHGNGKIYDIFGALNPSGGAFIVGTGPDWSIGGGSNTAGSCARGTGAGSTDHTLKNGFRTNTVAITLTNGATTYSIGVNQAIFLGSIYINGTGNGQVTCQVSWGSSRKWAVSNAYNRVPITLQGGDSTANWTYTGGTIRASNNSSTNVLTTFSCLAEEAYDLRFSQKLRGTVSSTFTAEFQIGIGYNVTNAFSGTVGDLYIVNTGATNIESAATVLAQYPAPPALGINNVQACEKVVTTGTVQQYFGTQSLMLLSAVWRG